MKPQTVKTSFKWNEGRRIADDKDIAYILPSDQGEVDRLKLNHEMWKIVLGGLYKSDIHDKLEKGIHVLDVGCGPGWWTRDMARLYPRSRFIGVDMADVFPTTNIPPNVKFRIMNAGSTFDFDDASFDFVFQRFLVMGLSVEQYVRSVQEMKRVLKPGGAIEIMELVNDYKNAGPAFSQIASWIDQAMTKRRLDSFIADKISGFLADADFIDIKDIDYDIPLGIWGGKPGEMFLSIQGLALNAVKPMVTKLTSATADEYDAVVKQAFKEAETNQVSTRFRLIYAKKE